jgi:hypothetical protein
MCFGGKSGERTKARKRLDMINYTQNVEKKRKIIVFKHISNEEYKYDSYCQ